MQKLPAPSGFISYHTPGACFIPDASYMFQIKMKGMAARAKEGQSIMIMLMRALWCHWLFTGGKCVSKKELEATVEELMNDYKEQDQQPRPAGLSPRAGENVQLLQYKAELAELEAAKRYRILKLVSAADITDDAAWRSKLQELEAAGVKKKDVPLLRMYLQEDTVPACPVEEYMDWDLHVTPRHERTMAQEVETNLWILKHLAAATRVRLSGEAFDEHILIPLEEGEGSGSGPEEDAEANIFEHVLQTLIMSPLAARGDGDSRTTFVPNFRRVLQRLANNWTEVHLDTLPEDEGPFGQGRTFLKCSSKQGEAVKNARDAKTKAEVADRLLKLRKVDRKKAKEASEEAAAKFEEQRSKDREQASADALKEWTDRWDQLHLESKELNEELAKKETNTDIGLDPYGCAAVHIPPLKMLSLADECKTLLTDDQTAGVEAANSFFVDVREQEDSAAYLKSFLEFTRYDLPLIIRPPPPPPPPSTTTTNPQSNA